MSSQAYLAWTAPRLFHIIPGISWFLCQAAVMIAALSRWFADLVPEL